MDLPDLEILPPSQFWVRRPPGRALLLEISTPSEEGPGGAHALSYPGPGTEIQIQKV